MDNSRVYNFTGELVKAFEIAAKIANECCDDTIRSAYLFLGIVCNEDSVINKYFLMQGIEMSPETIFASLLSYKEIFENVFGKEFADEFFSEDEETKKDDTQIKKKEENENITQGIKTYNIDNENSLNSINEEQALEIQKAVFAYLDEAVKITQMQDMDDFDINFNLEYSDNISKAIQDAAKRCKCASGRSIDLDNLIYSFFTKCEDSSFIRLFNECLISCNIKDETIETFISFIEQNADIMLSINEDEVEIPISLSSCCENFNLRFTKGQTQNILQRDKEKNQLWNIMSKKTKRNAILVGEPGVGKTAIVEAITLDIINETCPKDFIGYTVISFDASAAVAGTTLRGEFEAKIATLKKFIENVPKVILFIDEIHMTVGAGDTSSGTSNNDLSNALKSTLARNDAIVIGATTTQEYERYFSINGAYKRRFQKVVVREPKYNKVKPMIKQKIKELEGFHKVKLSDSVLEYIISASSCFSNETSNPDATLDLCDRAMSLAHNNGRKTVTKKDVREVYADNYELLNQMDDETKMNLAYHEAGHFVISQLTSIKDTEETLAISIIPVEGFLGANITQDKEVIKLKKKEYWLDYIKMLFGGRVATIDKFGEKYSGDNNDMLKATSIARQIVTTFGLNKDYSTNSTFDTTDEQSIIFYSDFQKEEINKLVDELLKDQFEKTRELIWDNQDFLDRVANALLKNNLLTYEELNKIAKEELSN